jgi:hypothetical protein
MHHPRIHEERYKVYSFEEKRIKAEGNGGSVL